MSGTKPKLPSEHKVLLNMLTMYEKILHPDFFGSLQKQIQAAYDENKREAFANAKISDDALWLEKEIIELQKRFAQHEGHPRLQTFQLKCFYKELLNRFIK